MYASCLYLDSVIGQLKGQLTRHAFVSGQNASCARGVVSHLIVVFTVSKRTSCRPILPESNTVYNHTSD